MQPIGGDIRGAGDIYTVNTLCTLDQGWGDAHPVGGDITGDGET